MRYRERFPPSRTSAPINVPFIADHVTVFNPSQNIVALRTTGLDAPGTVDSADFFVLPYSARTYPVNSNLFGVTILGLGAATPQFSSQYPQTVDIFWVAGEQPPVTDAIALSDFAGDGVVVGNHAAGFSGTFTDVFPLPAGIRSCRLIPMTTGRDSRLTSVTVVGTQTGVMYWQAAGISGNSMPSNSPVFYVDSERDTSLTVTIGRVSATQNGYTLLGYSQRLPAGYYTPEGALMVNAVPVYDTSIPVRFDSTLGINQVEFPAADVQSRIVNRATATFAGPGTYQAILNRPLWARSISIGLYHPGPSPGAITLTAYLTDALLANYDINFGGATGVGNVGLYQMGPGVSGAASVGSIIDSKARAVPQQLTCNFSCPLSGSYNFGVSVEYMP